MIKWSYVVPRLTVLVLVWALFFFGFDPALKWGLRKAGESAAGAKVDIASVKTKFFPPSLKLSGVAVADKENPMSNAAEFSSLSLAFEGKPLLEKKLIVRQAGIAGLKFGTPRKTSGALPKPPAAAGSEKAFSSLASAGKDFSLSRFSGIKADAASALKIDPSELETVKVSNELKKEIADASANWKEKLDSAGFEQRSRKIQAAIAEIDKESNPLKKLEKANAARKDIAGLSDDINAAKNGVSASFAQLRSALPRLDEARRKDVEAALKKANLPGTDAKSISLYMLGPVVGGKLAKYARWYETAKKYMPAGKKPQPVPARKGMVVLFPKENKYPSFLIKEMSLSGEIAPQGWDGPLEFSGRLEGLTTEPAVYGKPAKGHIAGSSGAKSITADIVMDRTGDEANDSAAFVLKGFPMPGQSIGSPESVRAQLSGGLLSAEGAVAVHAGTLDGRIALSADGISIAPETGGSDIMARAIAAGLGGLKSLRAVITLSGSADSPSVSLDSNIGAAVADGLKSALGKEAEAYRKQVSDRIDALAKGPRSEVENSLAQNESGLADRTAGLQKLISEASSGITGKVKSGSPLPGNFKLPF